MSPKPTHRRRRRRRHPPGTLPGTVSAPPGSSPSHVRVARFGPGGPTREEEGPIGNLRPPAGNEVVWVDIAGLQDTPLIEQVCRSFGVHRLTVEDIVNTHQRPKSERYDTYEYIVLRAPSSDSDFVLTQLSLIVGERFVLSFEENAQGCLDPVRQRLRDRRGLIGERGADYLAYVIVDATLDHYFPLLDTYADRLEAIEQVALNDSARGVLPQLYTIKEELRECRRSVWPLRDLLGRLCREDATHFHPETRLHLRDCQDHVVQLMELIESDRDTATALMELHVSSVGNRMNEVMKVLTIIATLFIPLSFITGLYGMNFDTSVSPWNMPELRQPLGYVGVLSFMALAATGMLVFFWRKGWLGSRPT